MYPHVHQSPNQFSVQRFSFSRPSIFLRIMKRRRNSTAKRNRNEADYSGPSFSDLPNTVLVNILLRLPIKRIFVCKCVCKTLYDLISDPEFAKLHFDQSEVYPLLRTSGFTLLSRMLYLVQPEQNDFEHKIDMSYDTSSIKIKLDSKLKLPLRNIKMIDKEAVGGENCLKLNMRNHKYKIVNSCNGLLCLSNPSDNDPVIVCNPVTGEFINLPEVRTVKDLDIPVECGFGFSPVTNQYKVIRMFTHWTEHGKVMVAEVHVLGTETWKDLPFFPKSTRKLFPTYFNGCVYWISSGPCSIISFDIEKEFFKSSTAPPLEEKYDIVSIVSMGVLSGKLCITGALDCDHMDVWTMEDRGGKKVWSKMLSINLDGDRWPRGSYQPIKYLNNGALLMFNSHKHAFIIYDEPYKCGFRYLKVRGMESKVEAISHIPTFVSLKHALSGHNVPVLNVKSRCGELKLHKEKKGISIVQEIRELETGSEDSELYEDDSEGMYL
ncbi:F-box/kelch-repeat protein At3g06240-like [Euphorbia lathyris]|uniref:F-box/kelch-repeat protein At3g06240-like n=1 Tax=Euphorbia lathyris TaxID=212925 RepID=UPI0033136298